MKISKGYFEAMLGSTTDTPRTLLLNAQLGLQASYGQCDDKTFATKKECIVGSVLVDELNPSDHVRVCSDLQEATGPVPPVENTEWNFSFLFAPKASSSVIKHSRNVAFDVHDIQENDCHAQ